MDVERPRPASTVGSGGRGSLPPPDHSPPTAPTSGGRGLVSPSGSSTPDAPGPGGRSHAFPPDPPPSTSSAPGGSPTVQQSPAVPLPIRHVYTRRLHVPVRPAALQAPPGAHLQPPPSRAMIQRPAPSHPMVTRSKTGSLRPVHPMNLSAVGEPAASPVPSNYRSALADPNWRTAMVDE